MINLQIFSLNHTNYSEMITFWARSTNHIINLSSCNETSFQKFVYAIGSWKFFQLLEVEMFQI